MATVSISVEEYEFLNLCRDRLFAIRLSRAERQYRWNQKNPDAVKKIERRYVEKNREHMLKRTRKWAAKWRNDNPELAKEISKISSAKTYTKWKQARVEQKIKEKANAKN